ncbi:MAG: DUF4214 domain-containing protein, partial [Pseudomonadota bacterium]|nr:DUF4214 domain-containing protein [Pseudomonadota bacterium]
GMSAPGGGGLNLGSIGSLKSGWDTVSGLWGAGSAASTAAGYSGALGAATFTGYGGALGSAVSGAAQAGGGFMGAASAAMPWLAGDLLVDNVLGLGITEGIVEGISSIFGGGKSDPRLNISTRGDAGQFSHESVRTGAFGAVGFSEGTKRSNDLFGSVEAEREWLASVAALDNMTAAAARTPEQLDAMTSAVQNMVLTSGDAQGAIDQLAGRTAAATRVIDEELTQTLVDAGASAEEIAQRFAGATSAMDTLTNASERLNLQFDASAEGAYRAADGLSQRVGGPEALNALLSDYYDAFYTEEEKLDDLAEGLRDTFATMGRELPTTREGVRDLVEGLETMGVAGQAQLATVLQTTPALREYVAAMEAQQSAAQTAAQLSYSSIVGVDGALDDYNTAVSLAERLASQRREQLQEEQRVFQQLGQMLDSLMLSNQSILDPMERLNEAQRQYAQLEIRAQAGDTQAAGQLQGASSAYLDAAAAVYGQSSSQYAMIFNEVTASVRSLEDQYGDSLATLGSIESIERQLLREQQRARDTLTRTLSEQIQANEELGTLSGLLEALPSHLASALSGILGERTTPNGNTYIPGGFDAEGDPLLSGASGDIANAYRDILGRDPDDSGNAYWQSRLDSGTSIERIREEMAAQAADGYHRDGLDRVPFDDYRAVLHEGETVLNAQAAAAWRQQQRMTAPRALPMPNLPPMPFSTMGSRQATSAPAINLEPLLRKIDTLTAEVAQLRGERADDAERAASQRQAQLREQERARGRAKKGVKTV